MECRIDTSRVFQVIIDQTKKRRWYMMNTENRKLEQRTLISMLKLTGSEIDVGEDAGSGSLDRKSEEESWWEKKTSSAVFLCSDGVVESDTGETPRRGYNKGDRFGGIVLRSLTFSSISLPGI